MKRRRTTRQTSDDGELGEEAEEFLGFLDGVLEGEKEPRYPQRQRKRVRVASTSEERSGEEGEDEAPNSDPSDSEFEDDDDDPLSNIFDGLPVIENDDEETELEAENGHTPAKQRAGRNGPIDQLPKSTSTRRQERAKKAHVKRLRSRLITITRRYRDCARDEAHCRKICGVRRKTYEPPFSFSRRLFLSRLTDELVEETVDIWLNAMSERTKDILGGHDFSRESMLSLPDGRVGLSKTERPRRAGTPTNPIQQAWRYTHKRAIYCDLVVTPEDDEELYIGRAAGRKGMDQRCGQYRLARANGKFSGKTLEELTPHEKRVVSENVDINIRCLAEFEDGIERPIILLLEDVLTMYLRTWGHHEPRSNHSCNTPEARNLFAHCADGQVPEMVPWTGLNVAIQSTDVLEVDFRTRLCTWCKRTQAELLQAEVCVKWESAIPGQLAPGMLCSWKCRKEWSKDHGLCQRCRRSPPKPKMVVCEDCSSAKNARQEAHRAARVEQGLCRTCGKPRRPGKTECDACAKKSAAQYKTRSEGRLNAGLCWTCGNPAPPNQTQCAACAKKVKEAKEKPVKAGLCRTCRKNPRRPGKNECAECAKKVAAQEKGLRDKRQKAGLCIACGERARPNRVRCAKCAKKDAATSKATRDKRQKAGLCIACGERARPNRVKCAKCAARSSKGRTFGRRKTRKNK